MPPGLLTSLTITYQLAVIISFEIVNHLKSIKLSLKGYGSYFFTSLYNNVNCRKSSERKLKESAKWHYIPSGLGDDHFRFKIVEFVPKIFRF